MTIVAGNFKPESIECTVRPDTQGVGPRKRRQQPQEEWKSTVPMISIENQLRRARFCIEGKARAVYEARFEFSKDGTAYRLRDAGFRIETLLTTENWRHPHHNLYLEDLSNPSATDQQEVLSSAWVNHRHLRLGRRPQRQADEEAPWLRVRPCPSRRAEYSRTRPRNKIPPRSDTGPAARAEAQ